jgi:hypothetical protein
LVQINIMAAEIITKEDLQLFKVELLSELKLILVREIEPTSEWIRTRKVRKLLDISPNTLRMFRVTDKLKFTKIGRIYYYKKQDVEQMLEGRV